MNRWTCNIYAWICKKWWFFNRLCDFYKSITNQQTDRRTDRPTDRPTDGRTDIPSYTDAWTHLKTSMKMGAILDNIQPNLMSSFMGVKNIKNGCDAIPDKGVTFWIQRIRLPGSWNKISPTLSWNLPHRPWVYLFIRWSFIPSLIIEKITRSIAESTELHR